MKRISRLVEAMRRKQVSPRQFPSRPADPGAMQELRARALALKWDEIAADHEKFPHDVWGILMETGFDIGSSTLLALGDGTTSLYTSSGAGVIGAGRNDKVRDASVEFLIAANRHVSSATHVENYPQPTEGQVIFYFLSNSPLKNTVN